MKLAEALALVDLLPPYWKGSRAPWYPREGGKYVLLNFHRPTRFEDDELHRRMDAVVGTDIPGSQSTLGYLKPWKLKLYCLQTRLVRRNLIFMLKRFSRIRRARLPDRSGGRPHYPVIVSYRGKLFVWNGHHRLFASILLRRTIRCEVVELLPLRRRGNGRDRKKRRRRRSAKEKMLRPLRGV